jgi:hypothetical protein
MCCHLRAVIYVLSFTCCLVRFLARCVRSTYGAISAALRRDIHERPVPAIKQQHMSGQACAKPKQQFYRLKRLHRTDYPGYRPQNASL